MVAPNPLFLRDSEVDGSLELILLAERNLAGQAVPGLRRLGLSPAEFRAMHVVARRPGLSPVDLARTLGVTKQATSRLVAALVTAGRVESLADSADGRRLSLRLTLNGAAQVEEVLELQRRRLRQAFKRVGADAVEGFGRVLVALADDSARRSLHREAA